MPDRCIPIAEGLFDFGEDGPRLIGTRCSSCETLYFPRALSCRNPACRDKATAQAYLPTHGTLYSFTIQRYRPPALFRIDDWAPYAIGLVELGEGVRVMGMLSELALEDIEIGMKLRLIVAPLYADSERGTVVTYQFAPDASGGER